MGKHKFNSGRVCEFCASHADSLERDENGKFNPCSEAPDEQGNGLLLIIINVYLYLFPHTSKTKICLIVSYLYILLNVFFFV